MRRRTAAVGFVIAAVLAAFGGWSLGRQVSSPAEIAAQSAAPEPSPILAAVETRVLSTDVVTRGTGRFGSPRHVSLVQSALNTENRLVTKLPTLGNEVGEGDVLLEVSGRPVIVLGGGTPSYRDLGPEMEGSDVFALEEALERLGHQPGDVDGRYDQQTEAAVSLLYSTVGYAPAVVSNEHLAELIPLHAELHAGAVPSAGVFVAADEVLFTPSLPVRTAEITTGLGELVDGPVLTITDSDVAIDGSVPVEDSSLIGEGMDVAIDEPDLGIEAAGFISRVAEGPGTDGVDGFHVYFEVTVEDAPPSLINASVRLTIPIESTSSAVLVVPIAALSLAPDGSSQVQVDDNGTHRPVTVRAGLSAKGLVEVEAIDGELGEGDLVLIGFDGPAPVDVASTPAPSGPASDVPQEPAGSVPLSPGSTGG